MFSIIRTIQLVLYQSLMLSAFTYHTSCAFLYSYGLFSLYTARHLQTMLGESGCGNSCTYTLLFIRELGQAMICALKRKPNVIRTFDALIRYWHPLLTSHLKKSSSSKIGARNGPFPAYSGADEMNGHPPLFVISLSLFVFCPFLHSCCLFLYFFLPPFFTK